MHLATTRVATTFCLSCARNVVATLVVARCKDILELDVSFSSMPNCLTDFDIQIETNSLTHAMHAPRELKGRVVVQRNQRYSGGDYDTQSQTTQFHYHGWA